MNFNFKVGDIVVFRPQYTQHWAEIGNEFKIVRDFRVDKNLFIVKSQVTGNRVRCRANQLIRVERPSDAIKQKEVDARKVQRQREKEARLKMIARRVEAFQYVTEFKIPLTADGLPDKRFKPRYTMANAPYDMIKHLKAKK